MNHTASAFIEQLVSWANLTTGQVELLRSIAGDMASGEQTAPDVLRRRDLHGEGGELTTLLPYLHRTYPRDSLPKSMEPTVHGVYRYYLFHNAMLLSGVLPVIKKCRAAGIPVMMCKGGALKTLYLSDIPRRMHDVDLVVEIPWFKRARQLIEEEPFTWDKQIHSVDYIHRDNTAVRIDLHHVLYKNHSVGTSRERERPIWERSVEVHMGGSATTVAIPSLHDMVVHVLADAFVGILADRNERHVKWILDIFCLMNRYDVDWDEVRRIADEQEVALPCSVALQFLDRLFPGLVDPGAIAAPFSISEAQRDRINRYVFWKNRAGVLKVQEKWYAHTLFRDSEFLVNLAEFPRYMMARCALDRTAHVPGDFLKKLGKLKGRMGAADA